METLIGQAGSLFVLYNPREERRIGCAVYFSSLLNSIKWRVLRLFKDLREAVALCIVEIRNNIKFKDRPTLHGIVEYPISVK